MARGQCKTASYLAILDIASQEAGTALTSPDETMVVVPIRTGLGLRLGYNVGYLKFTTAPTWNPF
jgi:hypothetical protein